MKKFLLYLFILVPLIVPMNADALSIAGSDVEFVFYGYGIDFEPTGEWIAMGAGVGDDMGSDSQGLTGDWGSLPPSVSVSRNVSGFVSGEARGMGYTGDLFGDLIVRGYAESDKNNTSSSIWNYGGGSFWVEYGFVALTPGDLFIEGWYNILQMISADTPDEDADVDAFVSLTLFNDTTGEQSYDEFHLVNWCPNDSCSWAETGMLNVSTGFDSGDEGYLIVEVHANASAYSPAPAPIPEPSTLFMFASGIAGVIGLRKKLKRG